MPSRSARFVTVLASLVFAHVARADAFREFRIPDHSVFSWTGDSIGSAGMSDRNSVYDVFRSGGSSGNLNTAAYWSHERDASVSVVVLSLNGNGSRRHQAGVTDFSDVLRGRSIKAGGEIASSFVSEVWSGGCEQRWYPALSPLNVSISADAAGTYFQAWSSSRSTRVDVDPRGTYYEEFEQAVSRDTYDTRFDGVVGLGF